MISEPLLQTEAARMHRGFLASLCILIFGALLSASASAEDGPRGLVKLLMSCVERLNTLL